MDVEWLSTSSSSVTSDITSSSSITNEEFKYVESWQCLKITENFILAFLQPQFCSHIFVQARLITVSNYSGAGGFLVKIGIIVVPCTSLPSIRFNIFPSQCCTCKKTQKMCQQLLAKVDLIVVFSFLRHQFY